MAHPEHIKAQALVELMTGESPRHVAKMLGIPLTTVKRWRNVDMKQWMREIFPHGVAWGRIKMAPKKGNR
jgi:FixJ family two-component response regulator